MREYVTKAVEQRRAVGEKSGDPVRVVVLDLAPVTGERLLAPACAWPRQAVWARGPRQLRCCTSSQLTSAVPGAAGQSPRA